MNQIMVRWHKGEKLGSSRALLSVYDKTGIVDFVTSITSDPELIRVSYTAKSNGIPLKQINGKTIFL